VGIARAVTHLHSLVSPTIHLAPEHCGDGGWLANTKVADFGTVREDNRPKVKPDLATDATGNQLRPHGSTVHVIGTQSYMPVEYLVNGHGCPKPWSSASWSSSCSPPLDGTVVRGLVDDGGPYRTTTDSSGSAELALIGVRLHARRRHRYLRVPGGGPARLAKNDHQARLVSDLGRGCRALPEVKTRIRSTIADQMHVLEATLTMSGSYTE
jgi:hypothetical protein